MRLIPCCLLLVLAFSTEAQFIQIPPNGGTGRQGRRTASLQNGDLLIVGANSEVYSPRTRTFSWAGTPQLPLKLGDAVVGLADGRALVTGGTGDIGLTNHVQIWDPLKRSFQQVRGMMSARSGHAMIALDSAEVLIVGGDSGTWEVYDVRQEKPVRSGSLPFEGANGGLAFHHPSGKVVFLTGNRATSFDPATFRFEVGFGIPSSGATDAPVMLNDGRILVTGGITGPGPGLRGTSTASVFDPFTGESHIVGSMLNARFWHSATRLPSGKVLVAGGAESCSGNTDNCGLFAPSEIFDPATNTFSAVESMRHPRVFVPGSSEMGTLLVTGEVFFVGGNAAPPELYIGEMRRSRRRSVRH